MQLINIIKTLVYLIVLCACISCQHTETPKVKHVIIIGVDGMSVGGVNKAQTPTMDMMKAEGSYSFQARNVFPTSSTPNWNAMLTSATASMTGVSSNLWRIDNYKLSPMRTNENGWFPDVFYAIKKHNENLKTATVYHWDGFGNLYDPAFVDIDIDSKDESSTMQDAIKVFRHDKPNFLFIQLDHVDHWGHSAGHMTSRYLQSVEKADSLISLMIDAVKSEGLLDETLIVINADHGGKGYGHGHETVEGNVVPYFFYGCTVKKCYEVEASVSHFNLAPLSTYVLGVPAPEVWLGSNLQSIFIGNETPYALGTFLAPNSYKPEILPVAVNGSAGGLYVNENPMLTINKYDNNAQIYYTIDGTEPDRESLLYTSPVELTHSCPVKAITITADGEKSVVVEAYFRIVNGKDAANHIAYKVYKGKEWLKVPDFSQLESVASGTVAEFSTDQLQGVMGDHTGIYFTAQFTAKISGKYTFYTDSDDGSILLVDGQLIVDNDGDHGSQEFGGDIHLERGEHIIELKYFNGGGGYLLKALVEGPGIPKQIISPEFLK